MARAPSVGNVGEIGEAPSGHEIHPAGHIKYGGLRQAVRICLFTIYFISVVFAIVTTQLIGAPLYFVSKPIYYAWMARTKGHFGIAVTAITQWWSPTVIRVTGDKTMRHQLRKTVDGRLECDFPERMVLIANHQLYSDWLYLWWIAYTARLHRFIYIILKESLKYVPILGQGMQFYGFIFLARKWQMDKPRFMHRLSKLSTDSGKSPMWLLIFPEGTNASDNGRRTSAKYAEKIGIEDLKHTLLPRSTGLSYCLQQLDASVEWMYDCTVAYEGVPRSKFGQDYFTLYSTFFQGRPPKSVNMHFRRYKISMIPIHDAEAFDKWLRERWIEKDNLMEYYMENGRFPEDEETQAISLPNGNGHATLRNGKNVKLVQRSEEDEESRWTGPVETEVKLESSWEVLEQYTVIVTCGLLVHIISTIWTMVLMATQASAIIETPSPDKIGMSPITA